MNEFQQVVHDCKDGKRRPAWRRGMPVSPDSGMLYPLDNVAHCDVCNEEFEIEDTKE